MIIPLTLAVFAVGVVGDIRWNWTGEIHHIVGGICAILLLIRPSLGYTGTALFLVYEVVEWLRIGDTPDRDILEFCIGYFLVCIGYLLHRSRWTKWLKGLRL